MSGLKNPAFVVSLDLELYWGVRDHLELEAYKENLLGVRKAVPALLKVFEQYQVHATWATVGFLFCRDRQQLLGCVPNPLPHYLEPRLLPYESLPQVGENETEDPFHYGPSLIAMISR